MSDKLNPQNYYAVEFDPKFSLGQNQDGEYYLYKDYLKVVNDILSQEGQAPLNFDIATQYTVDKRKDSSSLDRYNVIRDEVEATMNEATLWKNTVPSVQKDKTINFWSDKLYAVTKEVETQTKDLPISKNTKDTINKLTGEYVEFLRPVWYEWATKEYGEFANSKADGLGKGFVDFASSFSRGVDINLPELLGGGDTFWGEWANDLREKSESMSEASGIYTMSTDELLESKEYSKAFWVMMNHALTSLPQQVPSALSTIPALFGGGGPLGMSAMGVGLGAGYLQESGNFYEDVYDLYQQKRSRAKRLKGSLSKQDFNDRFGITIDMPDTKLGLGTYKTLDQIDDEQLRQMSEQLAQEYGRWSTGLELVNTIGDVWLGRNAAILKKALDKNPKLAAKQWWKSHWMRPYTQQMSTEGATEFGQEFVSEVKKQANLPEYDINQTQLWESGIIGAMYGGGFQGVSDIAQSIKNKRTPNVEAPEKEFKSQRKTYEQLQEPTKMDAEIIVGLHADPINFAQKVANHHDVDVDDVIIRMAELGETDQLSRKNARIVLRDNASVLEDYEDWNDPFIRKEKPADDLPQGDDIEGDPTMGYDPTTDVDDPSVSAGLDITEGATEANIESELIRGLELENERLKRIDDPNNMPRNVRDAKIKQNLLEIEQLKKNSQGNIQKKRQDNVIKKESETDELGIVGSKAILRTAKQNGKMGTIISHDGAKAKIRTNSGTYTVNLANLEVSNSTEAFSEAKKKSKTKKGRQQNRELSASKKFSLQVAKQNNVSLTENEKKLPADKLRALVQSKIKGKPKTASKPKVKATASNSSTVTVDGTSYDIITNGDDILISDSITGRAIGSNSELGIKIMNQSVGATDTNKTLNEFSAKDLSKDAKLLEIKNKIAALRKEDGSISKKDLPKLKKLQKEIAERRKLLETDTTGGRFLINNIKPYKMPLIDEMVEKEIIDGVKKNKDLNSILNKIDKIMKNEDMHIPDVKTLSSYIQNRINNGETIGNNKESFGVWRQGETSKELSVDKQKPKKSDVTEEEIDPTESGSINTDEITLSDIDRLMAEAGRGDNLKDKTLSEQKKANIAKNIAGETLNDVVDRADDNPEVILDNRIAGKPEIEMRGKERKKIESTFEKVWKLVKQKNNLTNRHFAGFAESMQSYMDSAGFGKNWSMWSQTKINKKGFRKALSEFGEKIKEATGTFDSGSVMGDEYEDVIINASEHARENIGMIIDTLEEDSMSVKDFTKISRTFFARYDFVITPDQVEEFYNRTRKFIREDAKTAYDRLLKYYSSEENGLFTLVPRRNLGEVLANNDKSRYLFKRLYNSVHPDNTGTMNSGVEGDVVNWQFGVKRGASNLDVQTNKRGQIIPKFFGFKATKEIGINNQKNPTKGVLRHYTRFMPSRMFSFITGTNIKNMYGFLTTAQTINLYREELVKRGLVPVATRGEDDTMILASTSDETLSAAQNSLEFINKEVEKWRPSKEKDPDRWKYISKFFSPLLDEKYVTGYENFIMNNVFKGNYELYKEHWVAKHLALRNLFGSDYIFMKPETIMKRIKIPFTPVYTSDTLPDRRVMYFDNKGATLEINTPGEGIKTIELSREIDGTMQYIGDGQTITSQRVFAKDYPEHLGAFDSTTRAKTVHYYKDGDNVHMAKHQEMTLDLKDGQMAILKNNKGQDIAVIAPDQEGLVNITDMEGNDIDYLMSDDEAKIRSGNLDKYDTIHTIPGKSIGMIQYSPDTQKTKSKFSTQLSYYFDDNAFQQILMNKYLSLDQGSASPQNLIQKIIDSSKSGENVNKLIEQFTTQYFDVIPQNIEELGKLGVGRHPQSSAFLRDVLKKKMLKPLADFIMDGSHMDFRADFQDRVSQEEVIIGPNNFFINKALKKMGKQNHTYRNFEEKIADINNWLKTNKMYTMITRSPIASSVGFGLYDIKEINIAAGDSFVLHPKEVKERFEGDHDHDTGHITYLDDDFYEQLKPFVRATRGLEIEQYQQDSQNRDISTLFGNIEMMRDMTYGETAIGEVVNASRYAGVLNSMFGPDGSIDLMIEGEKKKIKIRPLGMQVVDVNVKKKDGKPFVGELRELLRLYLQASVDHPKVLLLRDWKYTQNQLLANLFYDVNNPTEKVSEEIVKYLKEGFINPILTLNQKLDNMVEGAGASIKFDELFDLSAEYSSFIEDRNATLGAKFDEIADIDRERVEQGGDARYPGYQFIKATFKEGSKGRPTSLQELITTILDRTLDISGIPKDQFYKVHPDTSKAVHRETMRIIKDDVEDLAIEANEGQRFDYTNAKVYAQKLADNLAVLFAKKRGKIPDEAENSFINRMTPKTWDYSDDFIAFYKQWSKEFAKLSKPEQIIATNLFINGVATGKRSHQRLDLRALPPIKEYGASTLDPDVMKIYFKEYNDNLDIAFADSDRLKEMSDAKPTQMVKEEKGAFNCAK